jgi:hypothetical protein
MDLLAIVIQYAQFQQSIIQQHPIAGPDTTKDLGMWHGNLGRAHGGRLAC